MAKNFLIELGTEELPPTALRSLAEAFASNFEAGLKTAELSHEGIKWYAAPRRLALKVTALAEGQADKVVEKRGPAVSVAFDAEGNATKAAQGWARGNGITVEQADRLKTDKGEWLLFKQEVAGNADFRKFDDGLKMTIDCDDATVTDLRAILDVAVKAGTIRYGLHQQDEAMMTCIVPSAMQNDHVYFIDGASGGYTQAAAAIKA